MMALLRSRKAMIALAFLVIAGMVAAGAVGLVNSMRAPATPPRDSPGASDAPKPAPAPAMDSLGAAPRGLSYVDGDESCQQTECIRLVGVTSEAKDLEGEAAIEAIYRHLIDQGWKQVLPPGEDNPDDVPVTERYVTDGSVLVNGKTEAATKDATATLFVMHAQPPSPSPGG